MTSPRTVTVVSNPSGFATALRMPRFRLRVVRGEPRKLEKELASPRVLIGAGKGVDFHLEDPTVSALHCELVCDLDGLRVRDLGSKNGLRLQGRRVQEAWLLSRDRLELGACEVEFRWLDDAEEAALGPETSLGALRGSSLRMRRLYAELLRCASSDATLLLQGETGTGKELAARAVAEASPRRGGAFAVLDCSCLPDELLENELLGHEPGAFTGALERQAGAFERARGGTLLLDEVGELSAPAQAKLLGVLERRSLVRLGGSETVPLDVRVIAATHRELEREVNRGTFRADLYYRLSALSVSVPPLREHAEDIPELVAHFLKRSGATLPGPMLQRLYTGTYPGNVRELANAVERARVGLVPDEADERTDAMPVDLELSFSEQKARLLGSFERSYLRALMKASRGNVSEAARRAGLNRQHLHELLRKRRPDDPG